ncbi:MAG: UDP-N-acetylglucosamine 1-carboxyvinyltransferase [Bacteroidota bacterium]
MDKLVVTGGNPLIGTLRVSGSKNTALPLMAAALLARGTSVIHNVPNLQDINTFAHVLRIAGADVRFDRSSNVMTIDASSITYPEAPYELVNKMRASFYMLGALLGRCGEARVSLPGGCAWGPRPVDLHMKGMQAFGAGIELEGGYVVASTADGRLPGGHFVLKPSSVGATVNLMLAAATARGLSSIEGAAREPDVIVFGEMLRKMGADIRGLGTTRIEIHGVEELEPVEFTNSPDRIELGTSMIAAAIAGEPSAPVRITGGKIEQLGDAFIEAFEATNAGVTLDGDDVLVTAPESIAPVSITTGVYPGFPTDLQAQWSVMMAEADGNSRIVDTIYPDRFAHIPELMRMGMNAIVVGNEVVIEGGNHLQGAHVMSTDLRASVSLVLAGLVAEGETHVLRVYHLDRGYENLEGKLAAAGIAIRREEYDEFAEAAEMLTER